MSFKPKINKFLDYYQKKAATATPSNIVRFDTADPNTVGTVFTDVDGNVTTGGDLDTLYVSLLDSSQWTWNGTVYSTYTIPSIPSSTPFYLSGTTIDAGGNKTAAIHHVGPLRATNFQGNGVSIVGLNATNLAIGTVDVARLGTGAAGAGLKFLSDNNTWQTIVTGGKVGIPNQTTGIFTYYTTLEAARDAAMSGDTIFVYPGSYTVTTTDTNGLAKDGVNWFFYPGAIVTKTTNGWMFSLSGLASACNVYGKGSFYKTGGTLGIHWAGNDSTQISFGFTFEADYVEQTSPGYAFTSSDDSYSPTTYNIRYGINTGGTLIYIAEYGMITINAERLMSTAGAAIRTQNGSTYLYVNAHDVRSESTSAIEGLMNINAIFNINNCEGVQYGYDVYHTYHAVNITVNGNTNGIFHGSTFGSFIHNGSCYYLHNMSGVFKGGNVVSSLIEGGDVSFKAVRSALQHIVYDGIVNIELFNLEFSFQLQTHGGKTTLWGSCSAVSTYGSRTIYGGTVIINGDIEFGNPYLTENKDVFTLIGGKLVINGRIKNLLTGRSDATCVTYNGGTLVANAGVLLTSNVEVPPIIVGGANRNIKVLAGGLSTNRITGLLSAKKQKHKQTVQAISSTSIQLNDGVGGWEVFTVSDTVTYNTQAKIAQQMAVLINASGTLDITASQDTPGTDAYFYVESDVAGTPFTTQTVVNVVMAVIRENSYALTNTTGGVIIEDADVE